MIVRNLDMQVESLFDGSGRPTQWLGYSPAAFDKVIRALDPASGARLWSQGQEIEGGGWTPGGLPVGMTSAVRLSPSPFQKGRPGLSARPRCQLDVGHNIPIQQEIIDAGYVPNPGPNSTLEGAYILMGETGYKRVFFTYFWINPDFTFIQQSGRNDNAIFVNMIQWHGDDSANTAPQSRMGLPTVMVHGSPWPNRNDPWHLRIRITGGRHTMLAPGVVPSHPWDDTIIMPAGRKNPDGTPNTEIQGYRNAVEMQRTYDLCGRNGLPQPFPMDGACHCIAIEQDFQWDIDADPTFSCYLDGHLAVGVGGENVLVDGPVGRDVATGGGYHPLNMEKWLTNYFDVDQPDDPQLSPQSPAFRVNNYRPSEAWTDAKGWFGGDAVARDAAYDAHVWNPENSVWMCGGGIGTELADFPYDQPVEVGPSGFYEEMRIFGPTETQTLSFGLQEEELSFFTPRRYPRFVEMHDGALRTLTPQHTN